MGVESKGSWNTGKLLTVSLEGVVEVLQDGRAQHDKFRPALLVTKGRSQIKIQLEVQLLFFCFF